MESINKIKIGEYVTSKSSGKTGRVFSITDFTPFAIVVEFPNGEMKSFQPKDLIRLEESE